MPDRTKSLPREPISVVATATRRLRALDSEDALTEGLAALAALDPVLADIIVASARPALRKRAPGFDALARIVIGQQLSVASADACWTRTVGRLGSPSAASIRAASDDDLRACGLSAPKIRTLRAIAEAVSNGTLPLDRLGAMAVDEAHAALTAVKGIGPWTADVYIMFCLCHPDAFAAGDLALQEAARLAYNLAARPSVPDLLALAEKWRPWRSVAAIMLWAHYNQIKGRAGIIGDAKPMISGGAKDGPKSPSRKTGRNETSKADAKTPKAPSKGKTAPSRAPASK